MICKPNELACVVRTAVGSINLPSDLLGAVVTVTEVHNTRYGPMWILKEPISWTRRFNTQGLDGECVLAGQSCWVCALPDAVLQPVRGRPQSQDVGTLHPVETECLA